ncbi:MAG: hypothetical protein HRT37_09420 [Alteromonadaceae bacterium]|nr:hypothetical protein [Alteromonadaceae bacterium]
MKLLLKPLVLSATLTVIGLSCTVSYASSSSILSGIERNQPTIAQQTILDQLVGNNLVGDKLAGDSLLVNNYLKNGSVNRIFSDSSFKTFETMLNKPLLRVPLNELHGLMPVNDINIKGNDIYQVAIKFNDILQQVVAYLSENKSSTYSTYRDSIKEVTSSVFSDEKCQSQNPKVKS